MLTFPRRIGPAIVDWVDYADAVHAANPNAFADDAGPRGGHRPPHLAGLAAGYQTYGIKCENIATDLSTLATRSGGGGRNFVISHRPLVSTNR